LSVDNQYSPLTAEILGPAAVLHVNVPANGNRFSPTYLPVVLACRMIIYEILKHKPNDPFAMPWS
jgi:hypothetical protein